MSSTFLLPNPNCKISVTHEKKKNAKHGYTQEVLSIYCHLPQGTYQTVLDAEATFVYFDNIKQLYDYLRSNKNKQIATINGRECLNILVKRKEGVEGVEALSLVSSDQLDREIVEKEEYERACDYLKTKIITKLEKTIKNCIREKAKQREKVEEPKKDFGQSLVIFKVASPSQDQNADYHIFPSHPTYEFKMSFKDFLEKGFKIKIIKMKSEKVRFGISFIAKQGQAPSKHECQFSKSFLHSFPVEQGHLLEMLMEDDCDLLIRNANKNNGKVFETSSNLGQETSCTIYLCLPR